MMRERDKRLLRELDELKRVYRGARFIRTRDRSLYVFVPEMPLPAGRPFNLAATDVLLKIPEVYPKSWPEAFVSLEVRFDGRHLKDAHNLHSLSPIGWCALCFRRVTWLEGRDSLLTFMRLLFIRISEVGPDDLEEED
jgi:hypothetical protein